MKRDVHRCQYVLTILRHNRIVKDIYNQCMQHSITIMHTVYACYESDSLNQTATLRPHAHHIVKHHIRIETMSTCTSYPHAHFMGSCSHPHAPAYM